MRWFAAGLVALVLLSGCSGSGSKYPYAYLLEGNEIPEGVRLAQGGTSYGGKNPAKVSDNELEAAYRASQPDFGFPKPREMWLEALEPTGPPAELIIIVADKFDSAETIKEAILDFRQSGVRCPPSESLVLYHEDNILVMVFANGTYAGNEQSFLGVVVAALQRQNPSIQSACGPEPSQSV